MPALIAQGDPGFNRALMIDGVSLSILPSELDFIPDPVSEYLLLLGGGASEWQHRPWFDGSADKETRYTISFPLGALRGQNLIDMELIGVRGGIHRLVMWKLVPTIFTCKSGVQRYYLPARRKCAAHVYDGTVLPPGAAAGVVVDTTSFPTIATLNAAALTVTYATGPTLTTPGAGGIVIAREPDVTGDAAEFTGMMLGDTVATGDELIVWMALAFEMSMRAVPKTIRGPQESHSYVFVEV